MTVNRVSHLAFVGMGVGFLVVAAVLYFGSEPEGPGLVVEEPYRVVDDLVVGASQDVDFCIKNRTDRPLRIVGAIGP